MGFEIMKTENEAQAILKGSLKEFSRGGWGATVVWDNFAKIVVELTLYSAGEIEPVWNGTIYGDGDDLEERLAQTADNLGDNPGFKSAAISISEDPVIIARGFLKPHPEVDPKAGKKLDTAPPIILITSHATTRE